MDDLKQRVSHKLGLIIELGSERLIEKLEAGSVPANVLPIVIGVAVDKKAIVDGEGTGGPGPQVPIQIEVHHVLDYLRTRGLPLPPIDVESTVTPHKPKETP